MKIGVISDTHDHMPYIKKAIEFFQNEQVEALFHLGDFVSPFAIKQFVDTSIPLYAVFGNNEGEKRYIREIFAKAPQAQLFEHSGTVTLDNISLAFTHGHINHLLPLFISSGKYDFVLSGHTHKKVIEPHENGTIHVNPGEASGWLTGEATVAIIETSSKEVTLYSLN